MGNGQQPNGLALPLLDAGQRFPPLSHGLFAHVAAVPAGLRVAVQAVFHQPTAPQSRQVNPMPSNSLFSKLLLLLATAFFIWAALVSAGLPREPWLIPGGLAAWVLAAVLD